MDLKDKFMVKRNHRDATSQLARLNHEMAVKLIALATQTGDVEPLIEAVQALRSAQEYYSPETTPKENAQILKKLGDILFKIGQAEHHERALKNSVVAYRSAITLASLLGATKLRADIRKSYALVLDYMGAVSEKSTLSLKGAA